MTTQNRFPVRRLALAAAAAAMYTALSYVAYTLNLAFAPVQFRLSEALTLLPFLFPETAWGLFVGCILTNLLSQYGVVDIVFGSLATLLAGLWTARCKSRWTAAIPPVVCNALIVGAVISYAETGLGRSFWAAWGINILSVGGSEAVLCFLPGVLLVSALQKSGAARRLGARTLKTA